MVTEIRYTSINRVLDDLLDHPMLSDLSLEQAVRHTLRFMSLHGYPEFYQDKIDIVKIHDFRGELPCDLISIIQVRDMKTHICLRSMSDSFPHGLEPVPKPHFLKPIPDGKILHNEYIPPLHEYFEELSFKTQGRIIYVSFPEGEVEISYRAIPVDEDGFPLLIDNETYLNALEAYIKVKVFTVKFDQQKIPAGIYQNAQQEYAVASKALETEFRTPSYSEAESMARYYQSLIPRVREFDRSFKHLGSRQYIRRH